jgi:peroxiredoxin
MARSFVDELEDAFQTQRQRGVALSERLRAIADLVRERGPTFAAAVDSFVGRLEAAGAGASAPKVGEPMPLFIMPDQEGQLVALQNLLGDAPVVVVFHRGHWCPYCRLNIGALAEIEDRARPARIVAVSSEVQRYTRELKAEAGGRFPILTDVGGGYALSLNLAVWVDQEMAGMIERAGWDIPIYQGGGDWILPIPAVFVVGQDGIIAARHVDPDYRQRMEIADLLGGVDLVLGKAAAPVRRTHQVEERARFA